MKAVFVLYTSFTYSLLIDWLFKIPIKIKEIHLNYNVHFGFLLYGQRMCLTCLICAKEHINNVSGKHQAQTRHHAKIIYALEKTIYGLKKIIYGLERLFTAKRLFLQNSEFIFNHMMHF